MAEEYSRTQMKERVFKSSREKNTYVQPTAKALSF